MPPEQQKQDKAMRRILFVAGVVVVLIALCGLLTGASGTPFSMLIWSLSFGLMWVLGLMGAAGMLDPELVEEYLRLDLPRWVYALVLLPASCLMGATAWWTYWP